MANNPYINKIEYNGDVLIDLTGDTVTADTMLAGVTAHDRSGAQITGTIGDATQTTSGLMSAEDKTKLDGIDADISTIRLLLAPDIEGTTQTPTIVGGQVTGVVFVDGNHDTVRTDSIDVGSLQIVETRTLNTGESVVMTTDLLTLATTIDYSGV